MHITEDSVSISLCQSQLPFFFFFFFFHSINKILHQSYIYLLLFCLLLFCVCVAIFLRFSEMPTNNFIESSFWNFDALFQPQQHPARDAHDTFFIKDPERSYEFPMDYLKKVKATHEDGGGYGSLG